MSINPYMLQNMLVILIVAILIGNVFWIWALVDCLTKELPESKEWMIWTILIAITNVIGAFLYFVIRRPERIRGDGPDFNPGSSY